MALLCGLGRLIARCSNRVVFLILGAALAFGSGNAAAQGIDSYVYVHKSLIDLTYSPWQCACYSVSRSSLVTSNNASNQVWPVSRHESWAAAVTERNRLNSGPNACSFCPGSAHNPSRADRYHVFRNCSTGHCMIGVALSTYSEPGWQIASQPFPTDWDAWRYACQLHRAGNVASPDIQSGRINCATLPGGGSSQGSGRIDARQGALEHDTNRPGSDLRRGFDVANVAACRQACLNDRNCRAFTFVKAGIQGPRPRCWIKRGIPQAQRSTCCISGIVRARPEVPPSRPQASPTPRSNVPHCPTRVCGGPFSASRPTCLAYNNGSGACPTPYHSKNRYGCCKGW